MRMCEGVSDKSHRYIDRNYNKTNYAKLQFRSYSAVSNFFTSIPFYNTYDRVGMKSILTRNMHRCVRNSILIIFENI